MASCLRSWIRENSGSRTESHHVSVSHTLPTVSSATEYDTSDADLEDFLDIFRGLPDPRDPRGLRHELVFILAASTVAIMAGATGFRAVADQIADLPTSLLMDVISARNVLVLKLGENECGFSDVGDLVGAGGDVLKGLPAGLEQGEASFAECA